MDAMQGTTSAEAFIKLSRVLGTLPVSINTNQMQTAVNLLKAPLAIGETKAEILTFISRLAGRSFATSDDFIAWSRVNLILDLSSPPQSPFQ
jgi:hypothetical protein